MGWLDPGGVTQKPERSEAFYGKGKKRKEKKWKKERKKAGGRGSQRKLSYVPSGQALPMQ